MNYLVNQQIITAYEKGGLTVDEIAENLEIEPAAVKFALMTDSAIYRKAMRNGDSEENSLDVTAEESNEMLAIIKSIAREQRHDMPGVSMKAAQFVYNEGKGRNNLIGNGNTGISVVVINQKLIGMKAARERVVKQAKAIEVESRVA